MEASADGRTFDLGGPKPRLVLALLLLEPNRTVPADRLIDALWGDELPADPRAALQVKVSGLRRALEGAGVVIDYGNGGYRVHVEPDAIDAHRFVALVGEGIATVQVDPQRAATVLRDALGLWRGRPFGDLADEPVLAPEVARLEEARLRALERRVEADLALGDHQQVIEELRQLTAEHPLREGLWQQLMIALYRDGRQADALAAYDRAATLLRDDLGLDPSPPLRELHARVLQQDASLAMQAPRPPEGHDGARSLRGYSLLQAVGRGRLGTIHRARQPGSDRLVAVEVIEGELVDTPEFIQQFAGVTASVAHLDHPHIARLEDAWREPGVACLISAWVPGEMLQSARGEGGWGAEPVAELVSDLGGALDHAHREGLVAADLSLRDIVLTDDGRALITGLASLALHGDREDLRGPGARGDVLRLARIAFHLLTGYPTGVAAARARPSQRAVPAPLPPLGELRPDLPAAVGAVLARALSESTDGFASGAEFADALRGAAGRGISRTHDVRNPYKGLRAFREGDAGDYFGREALCDRLLERVLTDSLVLVGPSGCGKSSLVDAGLIPKLRAESWFIARMHPGEWPVAELERALTEITTRDPRDVADALRSGDDGLVRAIEAALGEDHSRLLLFVDQFEELYTLARREGREAFLTRLAGCLGDDMDERVRVVLTVRADCYDELLTDPRLGAWVADRTVAISPLSPEGIQAAIVAPAARVGVGIDSQVAVTVADQVIGRPGALPLLQFTLAELFDVRDGGRITLDKYEQIGGVPGALVGRAEQLYHELDERGRRTCRQVFLRLVTVGDGSTETRRRVPRAELLGLDGPDSVELVLEEFSLRRLLTFDRDPFTRLPTVEIAHEALIREWGRLRGWIDGAREDIAVHRRLRAAADEWRLSERDPSYLLRWSRLDTVQQWVGRSVLSLTDTERAYVEASAEARVEQEAAAREREARERALEHRAGRRLRAIAAISVLAALSAAILSVLAFEERGRARAQQVAAERQGRIAEARALAAASLAELDTDSQESLRLAIEAVETTRDVDGTVLPEVESALHRAIGASRMVDRVAGVGGHLALSPDGRLLVTEGPEDAGLIDIRDARTGDRIHAFVSHDRSAGDRPPDLNSVAFSPDGTLLATAADDGSLRIWDRVWETGEERPTLVVPGDRLDEVWSPSFSPDGRFVAAAWEHEGVVRVLDLDTGAVILEVDRLQAPIATAFSPDGKRLAVARAGEAGEAIVVDALTGEQLLALDAGDGRGLAWSPDGRHLVSSDVEGVARVWDGEDGSLRTALYGHNAEVTSVAWSSDSARVATGSLDGTAHVWRLAEGGARRELVLGAASRGLQGLSLSPDGERLLAGEEGNGDALNVTIWDVTDDGTAEVANLPGEGLTWVDYHPTRERVAVSSDGGTVSLWEVQDNGAVQRAQFEHDGATAGARGVQISPDGTLVAVATDRWLRLWEADTGRHVAEIDHGQPVGAVAWSPDGAVVASGDTSGVVRVTSRSGDPVTTFDSDERAPSWSIEGIAFSPDGRTIAVAGGAAAEPDSWHVELWDRVAGQRIGILETGDFIALRVAFAPSGDRLAVSGPRGIEIFDVATGARTTELSSPGGGGVVAVAWGPDGSRLAAGRVDGTIRLWDPGLGQVVLELRGHTDIVTSLAFNRDGTRLVSGDHGGQARVWALAVDELVDIAHRELVDGPPDR